MNRLCRIAGVLAYAAITYAHRDIIGAGITSLGGSFMILVMHPSRAASVFDTALFEYWIACALWCALPLIAAVRMYRRITSHRTAQQTAASADHVPVRKARVRTSVQTAASVILVMFVGAALTAPVIAPLPPLAQGDLEHTRFLPPLSTGVCTTLVPSAEMPDSLESGIAFPVRTVSSANRFLLRRSVVFSGMDAQGAPAGITTADPALQPAAATPILFLFGTDALGRDIFSRLIYGARYSIGIGFVVVFLSVLIGSALGMAAGYRGGFADSAIMRTIDVLMSVPTLFLVLTLMAILGQSVGAMIIVLTATEWMGIARIVRGEVIHLRGREFISASRLLGTSSAGILRMHILPNVRPTIMYAAVLQLGNIFLAEASLSFLGLGIQAPNPSWGNMIAESMGHLNAGISAGIFPGAALSALIVAVHLIGTEEH